MAKPVKLYQGSGKTIVISHKESAVASADEIEFILDSCPPLKKTMTGGGIVGVTATSVSIAITGDDTKGLDKGEYDAELRYTPSGSTSPIHGRLNPKAVMVIESAFV